MIVEFFSASPHRSQEEAGSKWSTPSRRSPAPTPCHPGLSLALYPPGRHLEPASDLARRKRRGTFHYKDYRRDGAERQRVMTLAPHRVHPPLPAPCPATRLSPHPALRLARQFRTPYRPVSRMPASCLASRQRRKLSKRQSHSIRSPALSLLRRPNDHHRDLRAMEPTTRATSRGRTNPERPVVTRHALRSPHAIATPPLRPMPPHTPFTKIVTKAPKFSSGQIPIQRGRAVQNLTHDVSAASIDALLLPSSPSAKNRNPHRPSPQARGFVHGRFSCATTASENLHHLRQSRW